MGQKIKKINCYRLVTHQSLLLGSTRNLNLLFNVCLSVTINVMKKHGQHQIGEERVYLAHAST